MAKRKRNINKKIINKRIKEGRGQGRGKDYQPWLFIQDVPSLGLAARIKGWKTNRIHHLMSKLETQYFYSLEWSSIVTDIREQYPLQLEDTLFIAERLGIKHPTHPSTKEPVVMTTDFVVTVLKEKKFVDQARTIKYANDLSSERTLEKLEIERIYWAEKNIDWGIVTENEMEPIISDNVRWLHAYRDFSAVYPFTESDVNQIYTFLTPYIIQQQLPLRELTKFCDDRLGLGPGDSLLVVRYLIANR